jgi:hypothetical protein
MQDLENFAETLPKTSNSAVCLFFVIENTITKVRFNDELMILLCSEVKIIFVLKF